MPGRSSGNTKRQSVFFFLLFVSDFVFSSLSVPFSPRSLSPFQLQLLMTGSGILLANISALTVHRLMESLPQLEARLCRCVFDERKAEGLPKPVKDQREMPESRRKIILNTTEKQSTSLSAAPNTTQNQSTPNIETPL